jgi:aminoglycoside phosphotransferase
VTPPRDLLGRLGGLAARCRWFGVVHGSGLSGATVWRGESEGEPLFALKRDAGGPPPGVLEQIHEWWRYAGSLPFIPTFNTSIEHDFATWTLSGWRPGKPAANLVADDPRLGTACMAIRHFHERLHTFRITDGPMPAIRRRLNALQSWVPAEGDGLRSTARTLGIRHRRAMIDALDPWVDRPMPLQPCHGDLRADHVLFNADAVTGMIDFFAMKIDHPAADAARFLGDACDREAFQRGCEFLGDDYPPELVELLHRSGTLGAMLFWSKEPPCPAADERLAKQIDRWNRWNMPE